MRGLQVRRWQDEGGMHVLTASRTFRARQMSAGYKHPQKLPGLSRQFFREGEPAYAVLVQFAVVLVDTEQVMLKPH